ncbi:DEAD/DEAH box helicase [Achromobacter sp. NFACC18-2]|uniref:DEAD/DEAH box helicase n=1 Tax=Achromobacter sp. NFACC18-2 TaxID=1564112 RepID=UPI0008C394FD|nr:DEAD/DEAH box helicase [Achromobacter sp. NFACC18-2]SEJ06948.1 Helicase conserved C-terminal domain-containing protein [Achromobacter sp. NFACC18-2]
MASSINEIEANIEQAIAPGFREKLLARGQSRSMIWREGVLPVDAPKFSTFLSYDLLSYAYSLLSHGLRLLELGGSAVLARSAFEHAGEALEAVVARNKEAPARDFHRVVAAASYHLGRFSARAFSLLHVGIEQANLSNCERCLAKLMLRDLDGLNDEIARWKSNDTGSDEALISAIGSALSEVPAQDGSDEEPEDSPLVNAVDLALIDNFLGALATALLAFERGDALLIETSLSKFRVGRDGAAEFNLVALWWCHKLAIHLLRGLWDMSFHQLLPIVGSPGDAAPAWSELRQLFIASLYRRGRSEIELWPSQIEAAKRVLDDDANLVLSLPTSAGKTRIAELCILACLAASKRVVFVTPLRALSAQTEVGLQRTFRPLGKTVSSLYGSIGASGADVDALRARDIIVATPEKLDFALRSDPELLDDVGLVVLDEGHMIGLNEREVRYEAQIQRLLTRSDAASRRIVCLSAILPEGDQLDDFAAWLTGDKPEGLIQDTWRPTRLRFGEVTWSGEHASLTVSVGDEKPFVPKFISGFVPPIGRRTTSFPKDQRELCLATAWRLVDDGQAVLIFCPLRASVEPFATAIVDLHKRGALASVFDQDEAVLASALAIGAEWFGKEHVLLKCLQLGVAVHHGALPSPYRKEVERLLRDGVLKITISSPTLAQGLNLSATSLVFHGLIRNRQPIDISEFRNVVGRAGRAYIDVEGLVLYPMFDDEKNRRRQWQAMIDDHSGRQMESGLLRLILTLLLRMAAKLGTRDVDSLLAYVAGNAAWEFPKVSDESVEDAASEASKWRSYMTSLDTAILSLLGDQAVPDDEIEARLDEALASSLFERRLKHRKAHVVKALKTTLVARAKFVWSHSTAAHRRGYFLAGVGLETGRLLDARAVELEAFLARANDAILRADPLEATKAITAFAEVVFSIPPFVPDDLPPNWREILSLWLSGKPLAALTTANTAEVLTFVEQGLIYKLPWAMEAVRVRGLAHQGPLDEKTETTDRESRLAVAAVETGTLLRSAAYLMQAGFASRLAAIQAVHDGDGQFTSARALVQWIRSETVEALAAKASWPTVETHSLWMEFVRSFDVQAAQPWTRTIDSAQVSWLEGKIPKPGTPLRIDSVTELEDIVMSADYERLGVLTRRLNANRAGLLTATASESRKTIALNYVGPDKLWVA